MRQSRLGSFVILGGSFAILAGCDQKPGESQPTSTAATSRPASQISDADKAALRSMVSQTPPSNESKPADQPAPTPTPGGAAHSTPPTPANAITAAPPGGPGDLQFEAPSDWKPVPLQSNMRRAQFNLPRAAGDAEDAELVVYYFGAGQGGNAAANLQRWRGQVTNPDGTPLPDDAGKQENFEINGMKALLFDLSGRYAPTPNPGMPAITPHDGYRMLAIMIEAPNGSWFVKVAGPTATMAAHYDQIRRYLGTARPAH